MSDIIPKEGVHDYSGEYIPGNSRPYGNCNTFSVGIFQWLKKSSGKGLKKSAVKFRVKGYSHKPDQVFRVAVRYCMMFDQGIPVSGKSYTVKRHD